MQEDEALARALANDEDEALARALQASLNDQGASPQQRQLPQRQVC